MKQGHQVKGSLLLGSKRREKRREQEEGEEEGARGGSKRRKKRREQEEGARGGRRGGRSKERGRMSAQSESAHVLEERARPREAASPLSSCPLEEMRQTRESIREKRGEKRG
jgi:hypothetical protein